MATDITPDWPDQTVSDGCYCCGGGDCCPHGDPPETLCVTFGVRDCECEEFGCSKQYEVFLSGQSFTVTRTDPEACGWEFEDDPPDWDGGCGSPDSGPVHRTVSVNLSGSGVVSVSAQIAWAGITVSVASSAADTVPAVSGCLPQTTPLEWTTDFLTWAAVDADATVTAGACEEPLMAATAAKATAPEPPCRWRGDELTGGERSALSLDHRRTWYRCGKPGFERLGLPVTDCRTCKSADMKCSKAGCTGYEPADVDGRPDV